MIVYLAIISASPWPPSCSRYLSVQFLKRCIGWYSICVDHKVLWLKTTLRCVACPWSQTLARTVHVHVFWVKDSLIYVQCTCLNSFLNLFQAIKTCIAKAAFIGMFHAYPWNSYFICSCSCCLTIMHHILSCVLAVSHVACFEFHVNIANWHLHLFSTTKYMYICATSCGISLLYKDRLVLAVGNVHVHKMCTCYRFFKCVHL